MTFLGPGSSCMSHVMGIVCVWSEVEVMSLVTLSLPDPWTLPPVALELASLWTQRGL